MRHQANDVKQSPLTNTLSHRMRASDLDLYTERFLAIMKPLEELERGQFVGTLCRKRSCEEHMEVLTLLSALVQDLKIMLCSAYPLAHSASLTSQSTYQLVVNLSYLNDQLPLLLEWMQTADRLSSSSKQSLSGKDREKSYQLQQVIKASRQIPIALLKLCDQYRSNKANIRGHLRLASCVE